MLDKYNFSSMEFISGNIKLEKNLVIEEELQFTIARVFDWYDECIVLKGSGILKDNILKFKICNGLEKGLYELLEISDSKGIALFGNKKGNINPMAVFTINVDNNKDALKVCRKIHMMRDNLFNLPKYICNRDKVIPFDVYVFCKNIKIDVIAQYEDVEVFPYEYLKMTSEVDYINSFFTKQINVGLKVKHESFEHEVPSAVYHMSNIMALDYEQAKEYAIRKIDYLNSIYTTLLGSHGTYFAIVTFNKKEKMSQISMCDTRYKGNLLLLAENGFSIRKYYKYLKKEKSYLSVYMKLLVEAKNENSRMLKYYRYWNILEGIASLKKYEKCNMKKWDGTYVYNKRGENIKVGTEALNKVFELVRKNFNEQTEESILGKMEKIKSVKEFLEICYQRRNCCAHRGECYKNDKSICLKTNEKMLNCNKKNIIHIEEPIPFQDRILRKLEEITVDIILKELKRGVGSIEKDEKEVNKLLNE